jgi:hypothetical protein
VGSFVLLEELVEGPHPAIVVVLTLQGLVHPGAEAGSTTFGNRLAAGF